MKVKELIKFLKACDRDASVLMPDNIPISRVTEVVSTNTVSIGYPWRRAGTREKIKTVYLSDGLIEKEES